MGELSSVRIRADLRDELSLIAAKLSTLRQHRVTIAELLQEGIEGLLQQPLDSWVQWAKEGEEPVSVGQKSTSFRIQTALAMKLGVLAKTIRLESKVPITKIHLIEEAGRRIIAQAEKEILEMETTLKEVEVLLP